MEEASAAGQPADDEAADVVAVASDRRQIGLGDDRDRRAEVVRLCGYELWSRDIQADYGRFGLQWGYASSPLLFEDALYVQVLHGMHTDDPSHLLRIDKATGKTCWRVLRTTCAIRVARRVHDTGVAAGRQLDEIVITGGDGDRPRSGNGQELWRADGLNPDNDGSYRIVASPVVHGGLLFAPSRERPLLRQAGGRGDVTKSHVPGRSTTGPMCRRP